MHVRSSSTRPRAVALIVACTMLAVLGTAGIADAAAQRPTSSCTNHPDRPGCAIEPTEEPVTEQAAVEEPAPAPDDATDAPPEPTPEPEPGPDAIDDPPTIITGSSEPPPVDECRNFDGAQSAVPDGMYIDAYGNCVEPPDMTAADGVDDEVEVDEQGRPLAPSGSGTGGSAPPSVGGAGGGSIGEASAASAGTGGATAVAGAAAVPDALADVGGGGGIVDAGAGGRLPFSGAPLAALVLLGTLFVAAGGSLRRLRRNAAAPY